MRKPLPTEHPAYYTHYINLIESEDILKVLDEQLLDLQQFISNVPTEKENYFYAPGKWTIKEVIGHIIDTERVFAYRAMRFARKDKTVLPGYDENIFVTNGNFNKRTMYDLAHEFSVVREASIALIKSFNSENLDEVGNANGNNTSVRAILFMLAGHVKHHVNIINERYLIG